MITNRRLFQIPENKKSISQNKEKIIKDYIRAEGLKMNQGVMERYFFLKKKTSDTLIEQTKTKPRETLEFKMIK